MSKDKFTVVASIPAYTYEEVHALCTKVRGLDYVHGFAGQHIEHASFFKDWQGMVRGYLEACVRNNGCKHITVVGIEGGPCSMEEAELMPKLLQNVKLNLQQLGYEHITFKRVYYLDLEGFKLDILRVVAYTPLALVENGSIFLAAYPLQIQDHICTLRADLASSILVNQPVASVADSHHGLQTASNLRNNIETTVRNTANKSVTVVVIDGTLDSLALAQLMPPLLREVKHDKVRLGHDRLALKWVYYMNDDDFKHDLAILPSTASQPLPTVEEVMSSTPLVAFEIDDSSMQNKWCFMTRSWRMRALIVGFVLCVCTYVFFDTPSTQSTRTASPSAVPTASPIAPPTEWVQVGERFGIPGVLDKSSALSWSPQGRLAHAGVNKLLGGVVVVWTQSQLEPNKWHMSDQLTFGDVVKEIAWSPSGDVLGVCPLRIGDISFLAVRPVFGRNQITGNKEVVIALDLPDHFKVRGAPKSMSWRQSKRKAITELTIGVTNDTGEHLEYYLLDLNVQVNSTPLSSFRSGSRSATQTMISENTHVKWSKEISSVRWSPDGTKLAIVSDDAIWLIVASTRSLTHVHDRQCFWQLDWHEFVLSLSWSPDSSSMASLVEDIDTDSQFMVVHNLTGLDPNTWSTLGRMMNLPARLNSLAWSPDGTMLAASVHCSGSTPLIWSVGASALSNWTLWQDHAFTNCTHAPVSSVQDDVLSSHVAWSPDSTRFVSASSDGWLHMYARAFYT